MQYKGDQTKGGNGVSLGRACEKGLDIPDIFFPLVRRR